MTFVPRYNLGVGTQITLYAQSMALRQLTDDGYEVQSNETGEISVIPFTKFVELLACDALSLGSSQEVRETFVERRLKGLKVAEQLSPQQMEMGRFHFALSQAISMIEPFLRDSGNIRNGKIVASSLNDPAIQKRICTIASEIFGKKIFRSPPRGGKGGNWYIYQGRTLMKYYEIFQALDNDADPIAALATLDHLKGNETDRIPYRLRLLMTQAWEEIGLDLKETSPANVMKRLTTLIHAENAIRKANELDELIYPSEKTLLEQRNRIVTPLEYAIATKGERYARNKHGKGNTDVASLMIGELCEIDEYKFSLVTSAKERGYWHALSEGDQTALDEIDKEIAERFYLLLMIDVASRMPLAWVISDAPRGEATLELLRMATRNKTREKELYHCEGDPAPAMGLGMIKNDNGTGLRNADVKEATLGIGGTSADVRTHAPNDKKVIERSIGTVESVLVKLIHGYTGRKAGDLPGYDSVKNGVLRVEELYEIVTKFFIDEYPSMRHMGVGMAGRRPAEVLGELNRTRGLFKCLDPDLRRVHLGHKEVVTPNDEGVRVFGMLWYSSGEFQLRMDRWKRGKVSVFIDPEDLRFATIVVPGEERLFQVLLQTTFFADMTLVEVANLIELYRREAPDITDIHEDRLARVRQERWDKLNRVAVERNLPRSYSTISELRTKLKVVIAGARFISSAPIPMTTPPENILDVEGHESVIKLGGDSNNTAPAPDGFDDFEPGPAPPATKPGDGVETPAAGTDKDVKPRQSAPKEAPRNLPDDTVPLGRPNIKGSLK